MRYAEVCVVGLLFFLVWRMCFSLVVQRGMLNLHLPKHVRPNQRQWLSNLCSYEAYVCDVNVSLLTDREESLSGPEWKGKYQGNLFIVALKTWKEKKNIGKTWQRCAKRGKRWTQVKRGDGTDVHTCSNCSESLLLGSGLLSCLFCAQLMEITWEIL